MSRSCQKIRGALSTPFVYRGGTFELRPRMDDMIGGVKSGQGGPVS